MSGYHSQLSPSAAHRWLTCTASARMVRALKLGEPEEAKSSPAAAEGTLAHAAAEAALLDVELEPDPFGQPIDQDMLNYGAEYAHHVRSVAAARGGGQILVEQRVDPGVPECTGTADAIVYRPGAWVVVVDYKYGRGVRVHAMDNPQLMLYALGALRHPDVGELPAEAEVGMHIVQPRLGHTSVWTTTVAELEEWRETVAIPAALGAQGSDGVFRPSESACRWCPAAGVCRARAEYITREDFGAPPERLTPEEIADIVRRDPELRAWLDAVRERALVLAELAELPGWTVTAPRGRRQVVRPEAVIASLTEAGYPLESFTTARLVSIARLKALLGPAFETYVTEHLDVVSGAPRLAPDAP